MTKKEINHSDEIASMFLGLIIVGAAVLVIINIVSRFRGKIDIPGISNQQKLELSSEDKLKVEDSKKLVKNQEIYKVAKGDSLWKIAQAKLGDGNKWTVIASNNKIEKPWLIYSGMELKIENLENVAASDGKDASEYVVKKGDNLWKIAVATYADGYQWTRIWDANKDSIKVPSSIEIGMKLKLPVKADLNLGK